MLTVITGKGSKIVGIQTVRGIISAVSKLHELQTLHNENNFPQPHGKAIKHFVKFLKTKEFQRNRDNNTDPGMIFTYSR